MSESSYTDEERNSLIKGNNKSPGYLKEDSTKWKIEETLQWKQMKYSPLEIFFCIGVNWKLKFTLVINIGAGNYLRIALTDYEQNVYKYEANALIQLRRVRSLLLAQSA